jgi:hypothetical protein
MWWKPVQEGLVAPGGSASLRKGNDIVLIREISVSLRIYFPNLFTITIMNLAVGVATGLVTALWRGRPVLWGTIAFLLNYIPILGPMTGVVVLLVAGLLSINSLWMAFLPARLIPAHSSRRRRDGDANAAGPALHHKPGTGHPLAGVLVLDVGRPERSPQPMLAISKISCDRIRPLMAFGHFMEG